MSDKQTSFEIDDRVIFTRTMPKGDFDFCFLIEVKEGVKAEVVRINKKTLTLRIVDFEKPEKDGVKLRLNKEHLDALRIYVIIGDWTND